MYHFPLKLHFHPIKNILIKSFMAPLGSAHAFQFFLNKFWINHTKQINTTPRAGPKLLIKVIDSQRNLKEIYLFFTVTTVPVVRLALLGANASARIRNIKISSRIHALLKKNAAKSAWNFEKISLWYSWRQPVSKLMARIVVHNVMAQLTS